MNEQDFISFCCSSAVRIPLREDNGDIGACKTPLEDCFVRHMKAQYRINIVKWEPSSSFYPSYMFLGGDKGILAYLCFRHVQSFSDLSPNDLGSNSRDILRTVRAASSQLDRPVLYVYFIDTADYTGIYFETDEQIRDRWLSTDFSGDVYVPVMSEMGDFQNLLSLLLDLKRNNVKVS